MFAMIGIRRLSTLAFVFAATLLVAPSQEPAPRIQIVVDQSCLIQPESDPAIMGDHITAFSDSAICHREAVFSSRHIEEKITDGVQSHFLVRIAEQEYLLENPTDKPTVFVVRQNVPANWTVNSDPRPARMDGSMAVFEVNAEPGQVVRLHVGLRKSTSIDPQ